MKKVFHVTYASSLTNLCSANSSFDSGVLRIAYHGDNRNKTSISKPVFEKCIKTMYNCPVVCNYDRETDTIGGHDMEVVRDGDGGLRLVNMTTPLGVIPESAKAWWETVEEDDGTEHEYLFTEVLLWKRQEAYRKIKKDGITAQSMEITVKDGELKDGIFNIYDFEFTAFALIGVTPCFESAAIEVYSKQEFKEQLSEMMRDLKESFSLVKPSNEDDNTHPQKYSMEGGEEVLQGKTELAEKYGIDVETLDFSLDDFTEEELIEKFEAMQVAEPEEQPEEETEGAPAEEQADEPEEDNEQAFALTSNIVEELCRVLSEVTVVNEWGEYRRYCYVDCDMEAGKVYCWDTNDWLLYGFTYSVDGDAVAIDFESKKRMKYVIADFDEGEQASPFAEVYALMEKKIQDGAQWESRYQDASGTITTMETELGELRQFKADTEHAAEMQAREAVFAQFEDLVGVEAFEALRENCADLSVEAIEEKCYAIRGRNGHVAKFALENKAPKLKVAKIESKPEPYGGLFRKYGYESDN